LGAPEYDPQTGEYVTPARNVVDGVTVLSLRVPGPMHAALVFRVGWADERLPVRGITHLVEHMALFSRSHGPNATHENGYVGCYFTGFTVSGTPDQTKAFLAEVTSNLSSLPMDRLPDEKRILRTESQDRRIGSFKEVWSYRWGALGLGAADYQEYGLRRLEAAEIADWATSWFTANNAVVWLSGDVPDGLKLNLRSGERPVRELPESLDHDLPAVYELGNRGVALSLFGTAGRAAYLGALVLDARVRSRVRYAESLAYATDASYMPVGGGKSEILVAADSLSDHSLQAAEGSSRLSASLPKRDIGQRRWPRSLRTSNARGQAIAEATASSTTPPCVS